MLRNRTIHAVPKHPRPAGTTARRELEIGSKDAVGRVASGMATGNAFTDQAAFSIGGIAAISKPGMGTVSSSARHRFSSFQLYHLFQNRVETE